MSSLTIAVVILHVASLTSGSIKPDSADASSSSQQPQLLQNLCANSIVADACRGFIARQSIKRDCHGQLLGILCSVRTLRCPGQRPATPASLENPVCQQSCQRVFRRCASSKLSIFSYVSINERLCTSLPDQLCHDWREPGGIQRDDRSIDSGGIGAALNRGEQDICQSNGSSPCDQVVFVGDVAGRHRRGAGGKLRHPFKKSDFRQGNYTYAAVVKLAKAEWLQESAAAMLTRAGARRPKSQPPAALRRGRRDAASAQRVQQPPQPMPQPHRGGYEKVLHLEIMRVLYTQSGGEGGHILDPGSVQIVRLAPGCGCAPVKLDQTLIFVGYNSYLENVWKTVTLLPSNGHYACKIKRCWNRRKRPSDRAPDCDCPCGKSERRRCQKRHRLHAKRRRGTAVAVAGVTRTVERNGGQRAQKLRSRPLTSVP